MEYPKLYEPGQLNLLFNKREFFICIAQGIYTSVVLFFVPYAVLSDATQSTGVPLADYQTFAVTTATALVIVVSVQVSDAGPLSPPPPQTYNLRTQLLFSSITIHCETFCMRAYVCVGVCVFYRSPSTQASGQSSTMCSCGALWAPTLPSCSPCTVRPSSRSFLISSALQVSSPPSQTQETQGTVQSERNKSHETKLVLQ